ncbi:DUF4190 domain-containing protein [Lederbergia citrea]|uniref:DUF4190 domain-containing protein n=1 Tax=Lederbergia citrea TaxID=2833581 RepID=UPI001BC95116|nr:DUF4190 domain-containing protein [Lederbergia citrea]MBS4176992.1 DUF4190 domain-containing protein [Lederbergia citrea]MBS4203452.1 DUF4190 domain-containing protein [Lederbergia citrea]MBS4203566.1 DUF4190 domain-containing protein [Lederbergia citrea]
MGNVDVSNDIDFKNNKKCIISLFLGILSIITSLVALGLILGIIGLIYGFLGLKEVNRSKQKGKAIIGIICCILGVLLTVMFSTMAGNAFLN